jgi:hypothetical protein
VFRCPQRTHTLQCALVRQCAEDSARYRSVLNASTLLNGLTFFTDGGHHRGPLSPCHEVRSCGALNACREIR